MINQAETSFRKTWNILMPFLVYFVVHDLAQVLLAVLMNISLGMFGEPYAGFMTAHAQTVNGVLNALSLLTGMASVWPMARIELRNEKTADETEQAEAKKGASLNDKNSSFRAYILLAVFAVTLAMGTNILMLLTGLSKSSPAYYEVEASQYGVAFGVGLVLYGVLSPLAEEIVFRGLIYNRMKRYFKTAISIVVCGLLFGAYHGNLVQGIYGAVLGTAITYSYEKYKSFTAPFLFHSLANLSVFAAGYSLHRMERIATALNCAVFLALAAVSLYFIVKIKK